MKMRKAEAIVAATLVLLLSLSTFHPSVTGFLPAKSVRHSLNLVITSPQTYTLRLNGTEPIASIGISGKVIGNGAVSIWLGSDGERLLIWSNALEIPKGALSITGMQTGGSVQNAAMIEGAKQPEAKVFANECIETCVLPVRFQQKGVYELLFDVEKGTVLQVDELILLAAE